MKKPTEDTPTTATVKYVFDEQQWKKLQAFNSLPWYKRIFRRLP